MNALGNLYGQWHQRWLEGRYSQAAGTATDRWVPWLCPPAYAKVKPSHSAGASPGSAMPTHAVRMSCRNRRMRDRHWVTSGTPGVPRLPVHTAAARAPDPDHHRKHIPPVRPAPADRSADVTIKYKSLMRTKAFGCQQCPANRIPGLARKARCRLFPFGRSWTLPIGASAMRTHRN